MKPPIEVRHNLASAVERNVLQVTAERAAGTVTRQLFLGEGLDTEHITASYDDGVLTVVMPLAEQAKPHKVEIGWGGGRQAVEAGSAA